MTLIEVLIWAGLLGLLFSLFAAVLIPGLRISARGSARAALEARAATAMNQLVADLQRTSTSGLTLLVGGDPVAVGVVPIQDVTTEGRMVWGDQLIVYYWLADREALYRRTWPPRPPDLGLTFAPALPPPVAPADLQAVAANPAGQEKRLASGVVEFRVAHAGPGTAVTPPLCLRLRLRDQVVSGTAETFEHSRTVYLRNVGNVQ